MAILVNPFLIFASAITFFTSLYESFQALTSIQVSHFVEWFSGSSLPSYWTQLNVSSTPTFGIVDGIDGGGFIKTNTTSGCQGKLTFNNKRHYDFDDSTIISVWKSLDTASCDHAVGLMNDGSVGIQNALSRAFTDTSANFILNTADATTETSTASDIPIDTAFHTHKIVCGASDIKLYIDGVLKVTKTTNRPTVKLQPIVQGRTLTTAEKEINITYLEAYNTSVTLLSSLAERFSLLTQVFKQRVVEYFSGSALDTARWTTTNIAGTGSTGINDAIDEGGFVTSGASTNDQTQINFNNKRQYDNANSICILTMQAVSNTSAISYGGLSGDILAFDGGTNKALVVVSSANANISLRTADGTTNSEDTTSGIAIDMAFHNYKIECGASNVKLYIDGVLRITKSTNLPTAKMQPEIGVKTLTTAAKTTKVRYLEAYNKLTTETDYPSFYELFNPLTTIAKLHDYDWFDGNDFNAKWTKTQVNPTATFAMNDDIDAGARITADGGANNEGQINFNNKRQYDNDSSEIIWVGKDVQNTSYSAYFGLWASITGNDGGTFVNSAFVYNTSGNTNIALMTGDGSSSSSTESDVALNTNWNVYKIVCGASDIKLYINGVLKVTKTTNRPVAGMQPIAGVFGNGKSIDIRYVEAKNV